MINRIDNLTSHYVVCYQRVDVTMYFGNNFFVIASIATLVAMFITFYIKVEWVSTTLTVKFIRVTARDVVVTRLFFLQRNSKNMVSRSCNDDSILLTSFTSVIFQRHTWNISVIYSFFFLWEALFHATTFEDTTKLLVWWILLQCTMCGRGRANVLLRSPTLCVTVICDTTQSA